MKLSFINQILNVDYSVSYKLFIFINCQASVVIEKITNSRRKYLSFAYLQHTVDTGDEYMIHDSF